MQVTKLLSQLMLVLYLRALFAGSLAAIMVSMVVVTQSHAQDSLSVRIGFLTQLEDRLPPTSLLDPEIDDFGIPGAHLGIKDNQTTGRFLNHEYQLVEAVVPEGEDIAAAFAELAKQDVQVVVADLTAADLIEIADLNVAKGMLILNSRAPDDDLRNDNCRANVLHIAPSRAMLADALTQYLIWKRWDNWTLIIGKSATDHAFADAVRRSAKRFGAKIDDESEWQFEAGARRSDTGHVTAQQEIPSATQFGDYDILIAADEGDEFGEYLSYRTYQPRPVAGTQGLTPTSWHRAHEQWGGTQIQRRFFKEANRHMTARDYGAWAAIRAIGEAVTQSKSTDPATLRSFLLSEAFKLAAFKGVPLTFRDWNGQMRQPILIVGPRMLVSVSPQQEFLHEFSPLDTLGYDRPESTCNAFE